jgi:hypothetical protein
MWAKQAALTDPTYPRPKRLMDKLTRKLPYFRAGDFTDNPRAGVQIFAAKLRR